MIRNLNQVSFQEYGSVLSERTKSGRSGETLRELELGGTPGEAEVFRTRSEVRLRSGTVLAVLSVSLDGEHFEHFYLDKPAALNRGVRFALSPFVSTARVTISYSQEPESLGRRPMERLRLEHRQRVEAIYTFFYQEKEQGFLFPGESHPMPELTYVDRGELHSVVDGQDLLLKQGDLVLYGPDQWHMQYADIGVAPRFVTISFDVGGGDLTPLLNRSFTPPQNVIRLLEQMLIEQERMDLFSRDIILSQLNLLLQYLLRDAAGSGNRKLQTVNAVHSENEIIRRAQQFITTHIREKLSVPLVAQQVEVSPSYLTALFHKNLQISPGEYIRRIKLQESKQMIRENNLSFTEIAAQLQYSTVHHFSRQFKEKFGITPTEYAKSVRRETEDQ